MPKKHPPKTKQPGRNDIGAFLLEVNEGVPELGWFTSVAPFPRGFKMLRFLVKIKNETFLSGGAEIPSYITKFYREYIFREYIGNIGNICRWAPTPVFCIFQHQKGPEAKGHSSKSPGIVDEITHLT